MMIINDDCERDKVQRCACDNYMAARYEMIINDDKSLNYHFLSFFMNMMITMTMMTMMMMMMVMMMILMMTMMMMMMMKMTMMTMMMRKI